MLFRRSFIKILMFERNVLLSIGICLLIFLCWQSFFFIRDVMRQNEKVDHLQDEIRRQSLFIDDLEMSLKEKRRDVFRLERRLTELSKKSCSHKIYSSFKSSDVIIYIITATYKRPTQKADLTRLAYTLAHVSNIFWIIIEDSNSSPSDVVKNVVQASMIPHIILHVATPDGHKLAPKQATWQKPRGVFQRNKGLQWLRSNLNHSNANGVVYIADDDNTYDLRLFNEMRTTKTVSVWPVAFVGQVMVERPIVERGKVTGWRVVWGKKRQYATDMAGFAVSLKLILQNPNVVLASNQRPGYLESDYLSRLITGLDELEPKADNCTKVYVWHTKTQKPRLSFETVGNESYIGLEV